MKVSIVIPCYKSEKTLNGVIDEIKGAMQNLQHTRDDWSYEIILVNDCSPDGTWNKVLELCNGDGNIKGIHFSKNFGQHSALMAGLQQAEGDYVVCLDDDGQTPANELGKLFDKLDEGYDVVYAQYDNKRHSLFRNFGSRVNEWMLRIMLKKPKSLYISSYFAVRQFIVQDMIKYRNSYPYVIGLVLRATKNIANVSVTHREREEGTSGYNLKKLLALWFNGFTAFSILPLRIATILGILSSSLGFLFGIYTIVKRLMIPNLPVGYSALMSALVFLGGMILLMLGLIGEYIGRIYISLNSSPQYVIKEKINFE